MPSRIIARRPLLSERLAQIGAAITHSKADTENAAATALSFTPSERPKAGKTDCNAVFPAAIVSMTMNNSTNCGSNRSRDPTVASVPRRSWIRVVAHRHRLTARGCVPQGRRARADATARLA